MSSGFITESEIAEAKKRRQEEWEKVRTADQPLELPEDPYDSRSLYDRLKEQKAKKDLEYEEAHKLKNLIRGLDDDEIQFLELVDKNKIDMEKKQLLEEEKELKDFRNRVTSLQEICEDKKIHYELQTKVRAQPIIARPSQKSLLETGIKRKNGESKAIPIASVNKQANIGNPNAKKQRLNRSLDVFKTDRLDQGNLKCVAILPGLGPYNESSDSEVSTDSDEDPNGCEDHCRYDLTGRKNEKKKHNHQDN